MYVSNTLQGITSHHITFSYSLLYATQSLITAQNAMFSSSCVLFPGSLSATSTADSLSSSFLCNAVNEVSIRTGHTNYFHSAETATCQSPLLDLCHSSIAISATSVTLLLAMILLTLL